MISDKFLSYDRPLILLILLMGLKFLPFLSRADVVHVHGYDTLRCEM